MSEAQDGLKDRDMQQYYERSLEMFETPGWQFMIEDLKKIYDAGNSLEGIGSMEDLHFRRGQIAMIKFIVAQPAVVRAAYEGMLAEDNE